MQEVKIPASLVHLIGRDPDLAKLPSSTRLDLNCYLIVKLLGEGRQYYIRGERRWVEKLFERLREGRRVFTSAEADQVRRERIHTIRQKAERLAEERENEAGGFGNWP